MKKTFRLQELGCANCAAKMEAAVQKLDGVAFASINFMMQRMTLEAADDRFEAVARAAQKAMRRIEPDVCVVGL